MASTTGPLEGAPAHHLHHGTLDGRNGRVGDYRPSLRCPSECQGCDPAPSTSRYRTSTRPLQGAAFVVASICTFLVPLAAALTGAALAGDGALEQLIGAGGGLVAASGLAALISGSLRSRGSEGA